ncbi:MAG: PAS domain S-box protein [bacterium]|nr:MAG: PAS domain S-box protein [bacterium]
MAQKKRHKKSELDAFLEMAKGVTEAASISAKWLHISKFISHSFEAVLVAAFRRDEAGTTTLEHWRAPNGLTVATIPKDDIAGIVDTTIEKGSAVSRLLHTPEPLRIICLPARCLDRETIVMMVGHRQTKAIPKHPAGVYEAVAGFIGNTLIREESQKQLRRYHRKLEQLVEERAGELTDTLERMKKEIEEREETEQKLKESYERYEAIFDAAQEGIIIHDKDTGAILNVNKRFCEMTGYGPEEVNSIDLNDISSGEGQYTGEEAMRWVMKAAAGEPQFLEWHARNKAGVPFWIEMHIQSVQIGDREYLVSIGRDITKRKAAEKELKESRRALQTLMGNLPGMAYRCRNDRSWTMEFISEGCIPLTGYRPEELIENKSIAYADLIHPEDQEYVWDSVQQALGKKQPFQLVYRITPQTGSDKWLWEKGRGVFSESGELEALEGFITDITERVEAEEELRKSEERLALALKATRDGLWDWNVKTGEVFFSPSYYTMLGYDPFELPPSYETWANLLHPDDREATEKHVGDALRLERPNFRVEFRLRTKSGDYRWILGRGEVVERNEEGRTVRMIGTHQDIDERKKAEAALHQEQARFSTVIEQSPLGISLIDEEGKNLYVNPKFTEIFGYRLDDVPTSQTWFDRAFPDETLRREVTAAWEEDFSTQTHDMIPFRTYAITCKDGSQKTIEFRGARLETGHRLVMYEDITARKQLEAQFQQAQKMEAIGTLAGGIAHDFNNLLMAIQGHVSMIMAGANPASPHYEDLSGIEEVVRSAVNLTRQLLGFARGGKYEPKPLDPNDLVSRSSEMFGRTKRELDVQRKLAEDVWAIVADEGQIEQVLLNLYVNAWQAMPDGGTVYLQTENVMLNEQFVNPFGTAPGNYVRISVADTGIGIDETVKARIFEPFFTTKDMGGGAGLGLAAAYGIIKNHKGIINVYSEKNKGAVFNIYLPASETPVMRERKMPEELRKGSGTVLLVDDEEMIINIGKRMLEQLGYNVLFARSGREAVELFREKGETIDMVLLDMIMPEMGGGMTFEQLKRIDPGVKVLLSSGYSADGRAAEILEQGCKGFIQKPFNLKQLSVKVREVLES